MQHPADEQPCVLSAIPGRLRVHLPGWDGTGPDEIEARIRCLRGVRSVQANSLTGNVLVGFDPGVIPEKDLLAELARVVPGRREARGWNAPGKDGKGGAVLRAGLRGLLGHAVVDTLFYTIAFAEPFGLPLAGLGTLHLGCDVVIWGVALAPLTRSPERGASAP